MADSTWIFNKSPSVVVPAVAKGNPDAAEQILHFFGQGGPISQTLANINTTTNNFNNTLRGTDLKGKINEDVYKRLRYQYSNLYVATAVGTANNTIGGLSKSIDTSLNNATQSINDTLKPVSSFIGSTLGTMTGILKDPVGSLTHLPNTIGSALDKVNPGLKAKYEATTSKFHLDKMAELPSQIIGSINHLTQTIDNILAVPLGLINDVYQGMMDLMKQINDFINDLMTMISKFITNIIDGLVPGLLDFLDAVQSFAGQIGGIMQTFSGANQILGFTNTLINYSQQLTGFIENPLNLAFAQLPPSANQYLNVLQNPQSLINQNLPPQLSQYFAKISSITGFGFNGNMGFGLQSVLQGVQGGVMASIFHGFAAQYSILGGLFQPANATPNTYGNNTDVKTSNSAPPYPIGGRSGQVVQPNPPKPNYGNQNR